MRMIDADAESERLRKSYCEECTRKGNYGIFGVACTPCWVKDAVEEFENAPTIEAEPVRHGRWKPIGARLCGGNTDSFQCSECEFLARALKAGKECGYDFCPNCGARMGGGNNASG